ncbi:MAG: hypothetical protein KGZ39_02630 [Simkania sp.]|nr:hypothetical protein [Simkania sp.]
MLNDKKYIIYNMDLRKSLIPASVFIIAISVGYYFVFYLPKISQEKSELTMREKCREVGEQAYKADLKQYNVSSLNSPQYGYNKKLRTCIYASGYHNEGNPSAGKSKEGFLPHNCDANWEKWVKDSYTNKEIISIVNFNGPNCEWMASTESIQKFNEDSERLFDNEN